MKKISDALFSEAVKKASSIRQVLHFLGYRPNSGAMFYAVKNRIVKNGIDISHFSGRGHPRYVPLKDILKENCLFSGFHLKKKLIASGVFKNECFMCGITQWNGTKLTFQLDHIDGDPTNNKIDNLRLLCPNCHSQTLTFSGRNKARERIQEGKESDCKSDA